MTMVTGVPHAADKDDYYCGRLVPKGAGVIPNLTALHQDTELYPNADNFEPDRFRSHDLSSAASAVHPDYHQRDHFNYGFGRRLCPGIHVAEQSLFIVVSRVLWAFDIREKPGFPLKMSAKNVGLIMKHQPFQVDIKSRGPTFSRVVREASDRCRSDLESHTLQMNDVIV
ncbi:MAG: hypothetical protein Q9201_002310 [Fulgogasparrea decipioides]